MEGENLKNALLKIQNDLEKPPRYTYTYTRQLDDSVSDATFNFKLNNQVPINVNPEIRYVWCNNSDITSQVTQSSFNRETNTFSMTIKKCYDGGDICNRKIIVSIIQHKHSMLMKTKVKVDLSIGDAVFELKLPKDLEVAPKVRWIRGGGHIISAESESYNKDTGIFTVSFKKVSRSYMCNIVDCDVDISIVY